MTRVLHLGSKGYNLGKTVVQPTGGEPIELADALAAGMTQGPTGLDDAPADGVGRLRQSGAWVRGRDASDAWLGGLSGDQARSLGNKLLDQVNAADFIDPALAPAIFGTRDSGANCSAELQAFVDYCKTNRRKGIIRSGYYKLTTPLWITAGSPTPSYESAWIEGEGGGYDLATGSGGSKGGTILDVSGIANAPGVIIQHGRRVALGRLAISGPNLAPAALVGAGSPPPKLASGWLTAGVQDRRYAPQCAVAIDPTLGSDPGAGANYTGLGAYSGESSGTAGVYLYGLNLVNHNVGVMHNPSLNGYQGDDFLIYNSQIKYCNAAVALGQSQSRQSQLEHVSIGGCRYAADGTTYGQQQGALQRMGACQLNYLFAIFKIALGIENFSLVDCYSEQLNSMGSFGAGQQSTLDALRISGGHYKFGSPGQWAPHPLILETYGLTKLDATTLEYRDALREAFNIAGFGGLVNFDSCEFVVGGSSIDRICIGAMQDYSPDFQNACSFRMCDVASTKWSRLLDDDRPKCFALPSRITASYFTKKVSDRTGSYTYAAGGTNTYVNSGASAWTYGASSVTFTAATPADFVAGDLLFARIISPHTGLTLIVPALKVSSVAGSTVTCSYLFDKTDYDAAYQPGSVSIFTPEWAPGQALTGTITAGGATITSPNIDPRTVVQAGDFIRGTVTSGTATFPSDYVRVQAVSATTITLSKVAGGTGTAVVKLYWGKVKVPTLTDAF